MALHDQEQVADAERQILDTLGSLAAPSISPRELVGTLHGIGAGNALVALTDLIDQGRIEVTPDRQVRPLAQHGND